MKRRWALMPVLSVAILPFAKASTQSYDQANPLYVEACSATEYGRVDGDTGGFTGHAVIYVKGACLDEDAAYPRIKPCAPGSVDLTNPESGVGVSVDSSFKNVNWMAVPGRHLFFYGTEPAVTDAMTPDEKRAEEARAYQATVQEVLSRKLLRGIQMKDDAMRSKPAGMSDEEHIANDIFGTDVGIAMARGLSCMRVPIDEARLARLTDYLNGLNAQYFETGRDYDWGEFTNSCAHLVYNSLKTIDFDKGRETNAHLLQWPTNIAIPGHIFNDMVKDAFEGHLDNPVWAFADDRLRALVYAGQDLPMRPGILASFYPQSEKMRTIFKAKLSQFVVQLPLLDLKSHRYDRAHERAEYQDLAANDAWFKSQYESALKSIRPPEQYWDDVGPRRLKDFTEFHGLYVAYLRKKLAEVDSRIAERGETDPGIPQP